MPVAVRPRTAKRSNAPAAQAIASPQRRRKSPGQLTVVESITRPAPQWLPLVIALQKVTKPVAVLSLASVLILYGMNVVMERQWGKQFESLERLKSQQRNLITLTERQKYQLPRNLEVQDKGYVELKQDRVLFVQPAPVRPAKSKPQTRRQSLLREDRLPVGY